MNNKTIPSTFDLMSVPLDIYSYIIDVAIRAITKPIEIKHLSLVNHYWHHKVIRFIHENRIDPITFFSEILVDWTMEEWSINVNFLTTLPGYDDQWNICCTTRSGETLHTVIHYIIIANPKHSYDRQWPTLDEIFPEINWHEHRGTVFYL